jgi:type II secretory pathway pseudopilin PulG
MVTQRSRSRSQRGQALIGLLIVIVIILYLGIREWGGDGSQQGVYKHSYEQADSAVCGIYTEQIRSAIMEYKQDYSAPPPDLPSLSKYGVVREMYDSPGCVYSYDATTGRLTPPGRGGVPAPGASPDGAAAPSQPSAQPGGTPTTGVPNPYGGAPIRVPTGDGGGM